MIKEKRLPADVEKRIPDLVKPLASKEEVCALFLFGSLARGTRQPLSDIDLAVLLGKGTDRQAGYKCELELTGIISDVLKTDEFDLVLLNHAPVRICHQVLKTGNLLFVKDKAQLIDFRERVVKRHLDFLYYRRDYDAVFMKGIGING